MVRHLTRHAELFPQALSRGGHDRLDQDGDDPQRLGARVQNRLELAAPIGVLRDLPRLLLDQVAVGAVDHRPDGRHGLLQLDLDHVVVVPLRGLGDHIGQVRLLSGKSGRRHDAVPVSAQAPKDAFR